MCHPATAQPQCNLIGQARTSNTHAAHELRKANTHERTLKASAQLKYHAAAKLNPEFALSRKNPESGR